MYSKYILKYKYVILAFSFIVLIVGSMVAMRLDMATNMSDMLPSDHVLVESTERFERIFGSGEKVYIAVSGETALRHVKIKELHEYFSVNKISTIESIYAGQPEAGIFIDSKKDNISILIITPKLDGRDYVNMRKQFFNVIEDAIEKTSTNSSVEIAYTGGSFVLDYESDAVMEAGIFSSIGWVLALIVIVLVFSFKRILLPVLIVYPLLLGVIVTFAIGSLLFGTLNLFAVFFAAVLFGLGIDFGIHLLSRYMALRYDGLPLDQALNGALKSTGKGIIIGALTTVVAFSSFALAAFKGFEQMGLFAALGITILALSMLILVPALIAVFDNKKVYQKRNKEMQNKFQIVRKVFVSFSRFGIVLVMLIGIGISFQGRFDYNIASIYPEGMHCMVWQHRLEKAFDTKLETLSVVMPSFDALRQAELKIREHSKAGDRMITTQSILSEIPMAYQPKDEMALEKMLPQMPTFLADTFVGDDGHYRLDIIPKNNITDLVAYWALEEDVRLLTGQQPVGFLALMMHLSDVVMNDIGKLSVLCIIFTFMVLLITFKKLKVALTLVLGLVLNIVATWGLVTLLGVSVNIVSVIAFPILIGIGIDGFVHISHRLLDDDANRNYGDTVKALTLTTITTILGFGSLAFVNHGGLSNLGIIVIVGMSLGYAIQVLIMPVALLWRR